MTETKSLRPQFVGEMPEALTPGVLYISLDFDTMAHLCACGCGHEIVTPLSPTDWKFTYDGAAVTVHPSIGNWSHACRSHYIIKSGGIVWAGDWSDEQVAAGRASDRRRKARQFGQKQLAPKAERVKTTKSERPLGRLRQLWRWIKGRP